MLPNTISCFTNIIFLENFFCINRSFLIGCPKKKFIGNMIFSLTSTLLITAVICDILTLKFSIGMRFFQAFLTIQFLDLIITARFRNNSFVALKRLDEKCGIVEDYVEKLEASSIKYTFFVLICAVIDATGLLITTQSVREAFFFFIVYSAQDAEVIFFSMVVEAINLRLSKLKNATPVLGSRVYRHVLVTTALMNEEITPRMMLLLAVVLGATVAYSSVVMLSLADTTAHVLIFLLWRELKVFFCLWKICYESAKSDSICQQLALQLAKKLTLDPSFDKGKNLQGHQLLSRWYSAVLGERPRFISGSVMSIGLAVPLFLLDLSVNYVLIIVQIYVAYN